MPIQVEPSSPERPTPDGFQALLEGLEQKRRMPAMSLYQALRELKFLDDATLATLAARDPRLLGSHCTELVPRGLLTREQLGRAVAQMTGVPEIATVDLEKAPAAFVRRLLGPHDPRPGSRRAPAETLTELAQAHEALHHAPIVTLRHALEELRLLDSASMDQLEAEDPEIFRTHQQQLARRALVSDDELGRALARVAGIPEVDAGRFAIARDAFQILPAGIARGLSVLPLGRHEEILYVASATPTREELRRNLSNVTESSVILVWADSASILDRVDHEEKARLELASRPETVEWAPVAPAALRGDRQQDVEAALPDLIKEAEEQVSAVADRDPVIALGETSGMARLVRKMVIDAKAMGASDIHIESNPHGSGTLVRFRVDGDLQPYETLPGELRAALVSRIKVMARLNIAERRLPQDGKIDFSEFGGERLELRVAILPTHDGMENVVLRLLGTSPPMPLSTLGLQPRDEATIKRLIARTFGLVLAAGPTGSGKTTTLHSVLMHLNTDERKIWTAEDPIEITQAGLNQVQVNPAIGLTFASAMRSFLRADPDVIMIGEIRDGETARTAIDASLTGHLVLSTLHTNTASESIVRLLDLGLDPMNFADSLIGIVAQRLVRALCPHCRELQPLDEAHTEELVAEYIGHSALTPAQGRERLAQAAGGQVASGDGQGLSVGVAKGCPACEGKGYKGRLGVYEILENTPALRELIQQHARTSEIFSSAIAGGMHSLRHDALEKVVQGKLDLPQARAAYL